MLETAQLVGGGDHPSIKANLIEGVVLERPIGAGATATVYLAHLEDDPESKVAVKLITSFAIKRDKTIRRWKREAELLTRLKHPNIVRGIRHGMVDTRPYLIMEFLQGESLMDRVRRLGKLPEDEILAIARATLMALNAAHNMGVIHRDIKPANIIRLRDGTFKLTDFGLAKVPNDEPLTAIGSVVGTPIYVSPEQAAGEANISIQSDLYSLGVTLFHLVTGAPPFTELNTSLLLTRKLTEDVPDPRTVSPTVSPALAHLISQLCQRFTENRPRTPAGALVILDQLESGELAASRNIPAPKSARAKLRPAPTFEVDPENEVLRTIAQDDELDAKPHFLEKEEVLFYEDDETQEAYILLSGCVDILKAGRTIATIHKPGAFLGEMSPLRGEPRSATVIAKEQTVLLVIPDGKFQDFFIRHPKMAMELARSLAFRLEDTNKSLRDATAKLVSVQKYLRRMSAELDEV